MINKFVIDLQKQPVFLQKKMRLTCQSSKE